MASPRAYREAPEEQLLSWSAGGDRRAFDEIVARHGAFALRVARRLVPDAALAEDLVQDAMVRAWTSAGRFDPRRAKFTTWLYRIVVNLCLDQRRKLRPEPLPEGFDAPDPSAGVLDRLEATESGAALAEALAGLPARQRAAVALVYDEEMSGAEAARVLGLTTKAVERLLARARAGLRGRLQPSDKGRGDPNHADA